MIGQKLSHYLVLSRLGAGGMAEVFLAQDLALGRKVALKVLPPTFDQELRDRPRCPQDHRITGADRHDAAAGERGRDPATNDVEIRPFGHRC